MRHHKKQVVRYLSSGFKAADGSFYEFPEEKTNISVGMKILDKLWILDKNSSQ